MSGMIRRGVAHDRRLHKRRTGDDRRPVGAYLCRDRRIRVELVEEDRRMFDRRLCDRRVCADRRQPPDGAAA